MAARLPHYLSAWDRPEHLKSASHYYIRVQGTDRLISADRNGPYALLNGLRVPRYMSHKAKQARAKCNFPCSIIHRANQAHFNCNSYSSVL